MSDKHLSSGGLPNVFRANKCSFLRLLMLSLFGFCSLLFFLSPGILTVARTASKKGTFRVNKQHKIVEMLALLGPFCLIFQCLPKVFQTALMCFYLFGRKETWRGIETGRAGWMKSRAERDVAGIFYLRSFVGIWTQMFEELSGALDLYANKQKCLLDFWTLGNWNSGLRKLCFMFWSAKVCNWLTFPSLEISSFSTHSAVKLKKTFTLPFNSGKLLKFEGKWMWK